jgi:hypothetical protein
MDSIYRKASNVLIWLGAASEGSTEVMQYLSRIGKQFLDRGGPVLEPKVEQQCEEHGAQNKILWDGVYGDKEVMKRSDEVWTRPWFSRRWIIQEVAFAQAATVHCGNSKIEWDVLAMAAEVLATLEGDGSQFINRRTGEGKGPASPALQNVAKLQRIRKEVLMGVAAPAGGEMHACLEGARGFECRDDKDRVFSLLGIFNHRRKTPFRIEYGKSEAEVFEAFTRYCLREGESVDILCWAGISNHARCGESLKLPSWVPDWRLPFRSPTDMIHGFRAGAIFKTPIGLDDSNTELLLKGKVVDRVIAVMKPISDIEEIQMANGSLKWDVCEPRYIGLWFQSLEMVLFLALDAIGKREEEYIGGGGDIWKALARTLIMDKKDVSFDYKRSRDYLIRPEDVPDDEPQPELPDEFTAFRNYLYAKCGDLTGQDRIVWLGNTIMIDYEMMEYLSRAVDRSQDRIFYVTRKGYIGLGPKDMDTDDIICVLAGSRVPHVLRPLNKDFRMFNELPLPECLRRGSWKFGGVEMPFIDRARKEKFQLIGECYTQGLMDGQVWTVSHAAIEDFTLV